MGLKSRQNFPEANVMRKQTFIMTLVASILLTLSVNQANAMGRGKPVEPTPAPTPAPKPPAPLPTPTPAPAPVSDTSDATPLWEGKVKGSREWTNHVYSELDRLGQDLLDVIPADTATFCPKYRNLNYEQRKKYWIYLISAMARFESGFKTDTSYTENFNDSSGSNVISRGLLQISIESSRGYDCGLTSAQQLHDPFKNLSCGVRILDRWVGRDGRIAGKVDSKWRGGARYWSVLREGDKTSYKSIVSWSRNLKMCH